MKDAMMPQVQSVSSRSTVFSQASTLPTKQAKVATKTNRQHLCCPRMVMGIISIVGAAGAVLLSQSTQAITTQSVPPEFLTAQEHQKETPSLRSERETSTTSLALRDSQSFPETLVKLPSIPPRSFSVVSEERSPWRRVIPFLPKLSTSFSLALPSIASAGSLSRRHGLSPQTTIAPTVFIDQQIDKAIGGSASMPRTLSSDAELTEPEIVGDERWELGDTLLNLWTLNHTQKPESNPNQPRGQLEADVMKLQQKHTSLYAERLSQSDYPDIQRTQLNRKQESSQPLQATAPASREIEDTYTRVHSLEGQIVEPELPPLSSPEQYLPDSSSRFRGYIWPSKGVITSGYGRRWGRMHKGIDIAGPVGTPIIAVAPGEVVTAGWSSGGYGNLVELKHADGSLTLYAHNSRILVRRGQRVQQGQLIAEMGSSGYSTGPHLHFEIHPNGRDAVNPIAYLPKQP